MENGPIPPVVKNAWLECNVLESSTTEMRVEIALQDGSTTNILVSPTVTSSIGTKDYIRVEEIARKDGIAFIKLPSPSLQHGHNINVSEKSLRKPSQ